MMAQKVYTLMGNYYPDDSDVLSAYASKESADREKAKCEAHRAAEPIPTWREDDPDGSKWMEAHDIWTKGLPGGANYDYYTVEERELLP